MLSTIKTLIENPMYLINGYTIDDDEIVLFVSERTSEQANIPSIIDDKKVVIVN